MEDISIPGITENIEAEEAAPVNEPESEPAPVPVPVMEDVTEKAMVEVETPTEETVSEDIIEYEPVTIIFAGDMNFDRRYANMNALSGRGGEISEALDEDIRNAMLEADITMINNESRQK